MVTGCLVATGRGQAPGGLEGLWAPKAPGRAQGGAFPRDAQPGGGGQPAEASQVAPLFLMSFPCLSRKRLSRSHGDHGPVRRSQGLRVHKGLRQALLRDRRRPTCPEGHPLIPDSLYMPWKKTRPPSWFCIFKSCFRWPGPRPPGPCTSSPGTQKPGERWEWELAEAG